MTTLEELRAKREQIYAIAAENGVENIRVFGSVVRGEDNPDSDIDLLCDIQEGRSLFDFGGAQYRLQEFLGRKVDLVPAESVHWFIKDKVFAEAKPL